MGNSISRAMERDAERQVERQMAEILRRRNINNGQMPKHVDQSPPTYEKATGLPSYKEAIKSKSPKK